MWLYIPHELCHYSLRHAATGIFDRDTMISYEFETTCPLRQSQKHTILIH